MAGKKIAFVGTGAQGAGIGADPAVRPDST